MLRVENLSFAYEENQILNNVSFSISPGEFVLVCGTSGSGKTTLLRHLKKEMLPVGKTLGTVFFKNQNIENLDTSTDIGYVFQNPDHQIVSDRVYHELAFGLENQNMDIMTMRQKIAEFLQYFNMSAMYHQETDTLSGGQKQLLNIASILLMQPKFLLLDEPLSQLDPMMQETFMQMLIKLNREYGTTIVMVEHHYERVLPACDKVLLLQAGKIACVGETVDIIKKLLVQKHQLTKGFPAYYRLYPYINTLPLSIKEARYQIGKLKFSSHIVKVSTSTKIVGEVHKLRFGYEKDLLNNVSFTMYQGDIIGIIGGNGSGKTTLLKVLIGSLKKQKGKINLPKKVGYVSQDPTSLFLKDTIYEDIKEVASKEEEITEMLKIIGLLEKRNLHPYDLSGGEQQLLALGKVLLTKPQVLLLDEPTKGLDIESREKLGKLLQSIRHQTSVLIVSHDVEFIATYTNRCGMLFDGYLESLEETRKLLKNNTFYTTTTRKICKDYKDEVLLYEDIIFP